MTKLNQILSIWIPGDVHTLKWFQGQGIEQRTAHQYFQSGSIQKIGYGVYARKNDTLHWAGAVRAMQSELHTKAHVGGYTALSLQGAAHNLDFKAPIELLTYSKLNLPKWVIENSWNRKISLRRSSLFDGKLPLIEHKIDGLNISISCRELAIIEYANKLDLSHSFESLENQLESLYTLRSDVIQNLLESCHSVKTKRVFLYVSESLELPFFKKLNLNAIDLGKGKRVIVKNGQLNRKYLITVPAKSEENPF